MPKASEEKKEKKALMVQEEKTQTPSDLIRLAVQHGADLEKLEKVLHLQKEWEAMQAKKAYNEAMAAFKADPPKIDKDKKVSYAAGGGRTNYKHASLYNVTQKISAALSKHGLSARWTTKQSDNCISVTCDITHRLGHSESTTLSACADKSGSKNDIQAVGSTVTYLERYTLLALTGLATYDTDDDGNGVVMEFISNKEANTIMDLIAEKEINLQKFLEYMKIEDIQKMPKEKYQQALIAISQKKSAR